MSEAKHCTAIENELALYVGGELAAHVRTQVQEHLLHCGTCTAAVARLAAARSALREGLERSGARAPDLWQGVRARLVESGTLAGQPAAAAALASTRRPRALPHWIPVSAAAAALLGIGLWMFSGAQDAPVRERVIAGVQPVALPVSAPTGLRRLGSDETPLSNSAISIEQLEFEKLMRASAQPGGVEAVSQHYGIH
ncbi:MAG: zf-HC2 domain-containing protein [Planctomycetes bacterium]|nr:zf-HC2 domain-containing protein [Planctomycetota bacterium]